MSEKLYKYRSLAGTTGIEYSVDIIKNNRLYFPTRQELNDPYEGSARPINLAVCGEGNFLAMGCIHPIVENTMNQYRVLSLSGTSKSMQMWAHYASNYNGICFEFCKEGVIGQAKKVEYIESPFEEVRESDFDDFEEVVKSNFYYKSIGWKYEDEYRIVDKSKKKFIEFAPEELTGIIIGQEALKREDVKEKIVKLAKEKGIPVYKPFFTPRTYELRFIPVDKEIKWGLDTLENLNYI